MDMQVKRPLYRPYERSYGIGVLAILAILLIAFVPNDLLYITNDLLLAVVICLRGFFISIALITWYLTKKHIPDPVYNKLVILLTVTASFMAVFIEWTRPRDFLVSCMPILMFICYSFFILPAPHRIKLTAALVVSGVEILILLFWKNASGGGRNSIAVSILALDCIGVFNALEIKRLKKLEIRYFQDAEESVIFRQALSGDAELAVAVHHNDEILNCNLRFIDLASRCGISENYLGRLKLSSFLFIGEDVLESFKRGDGVGARAMGILGSIPVEARNRFFYLDNKMYQATTIRDLSRDAIDDMQSQDNDRIRMNIHNLPISEREKAIVTAIARGKTGFQIADDLCVSDTALERKILAIYRKIGVSTMIDLMKVIMK